MPRTEDSNNRQNLPRISMIATPIGNLSDLSERAVETLRRVDEIWCEDTRHTQALLTALEIKGKLLRRVDQHSGESELKGLLQGLQAKGQWVGVVTDAGTPGLSDPGAALTGLLSEFPGIQCEPVPGPSALSALVSVGGFSGSSLYFHGFFPRTRGEALELLKNLKDAALCPNWVFFESPHRILETIQVLEAWCESSGVEPAFVFAKELTKAHETVFRGGGRSFLKRLQDQGLDERGEWVFSLSLSKNYLNKKSADPAWESSLQCLIEAGIAAKTACQIVSVRFSVAKNLAYRRALEFQKK
jgi:16S rRNA (cytidine1402-2'-O)-methyltransferase